MTKTEYNQLKAEIIRKYGSPEYSMNSAVNESAKKLLELKQNYLNLRAEANNLKRLANENKLELAIPSKSVVEVPEEIIKAEWLLPFDEKERLIIDQWLTNTRQRVKDIAEALNLTPKEIRKLLNSEAFNVLRMHIAKGYFDMLPIEASAALRDCLNSSTPNVKLNAAMAILTNAGLIKSERIQLDVNKEFKLPDDPEQLKKLQQAAKAVMGRE